jgi:hypothetical protein
MLNFSHWLAATPASRTIQTVLWIIPTVQTIHILAVAMVVSAVGMIILRILGVAGRSQDVPQTARRFLPWIWSGLVVLAVSGATLIVGEPARDLNNPAFWTKMSLVALAIAVTLAFQLSLRRKAPIWEDAPARPAGVNYLAVATFLVWCAIMVAGRWIAYVKVPDVASG